VSSNVLCYGAVFSIDRHLNLWYDHGWGRGGDIIEFGVQFYRRSIREVLKILQEFGAHPGDLVAENSMAASSRIEVLQAKPIGAVRRVVGVNTNNKIIWQGGPNRIGVWMN